MIDAESFLRDLPRPDLIDGWQLVCTTLRVLATLEVQAVPDQRIWEAADINRSTWKAYDDLLVRTDVWRTPATSCGWVTGWAVASQLVSSLTPGPTRTSWSVAAIRRSGTDGAGHEEAVPPTQRAV